MNKIGVGCDCFTGCSPQNFSSAWKLAQLEVWKLQLSLSLNYNVEDANSTKLLLIQ